MTVRTVTLALLALSLAVLTAGHVAMSDAAFTATKSNPGNTLTASSSFPGIRVSSGSYTGNGSDNRNITGVGFQPDAVIVKKASGSNGQREAAVIRTSTMPGDTTKPLTGATGLQPNMVQALLGDGFQVGGDNHVNRNGATYYWIAFKTYPGHMTLGTYTGTGADRSIGGLGFSPEYVIVGAATGQPVVQRMSAMSRTFRFDADTGITNGITSLDADGFSLGTNDAVNQNGTDYGYLAFNQDVDEMQTSSYTGNAAASRSITGVGFQPNYVIVHADDTTTAREGVHRPTAVPGATSLPFDDTANTISNGVTALQSDGLQVGNNAATNAATVEYDYVAFKDKP